MYQQCVTSFSKPPLNSLSIVACTSHATVTPSLGCHNLMNLLLSPSCSAFPPDGTCIYRLYCGAPAECGRATLGVVGYIQWIRPDFLSSGNVEFRKEVRDSNIWLYCLCLKDRTACAKWNEIYQKSSGGLKRDTWNQVRDHTSPLSMTSPGFWRMDQMRWAQETGEESRLRGGAAWAVRGQGAVKCGWDTRCAESCDGKPGGRGGPELCLRRPGKPQVDTLPLEPMTRSEASKMLMALLSFFTDHSASFLGENFSHYGSHPWELQGLSAIWIYHVKGMKARKSVRKFYKKSSLVSITSNVHWSKHHYYNRHLMSKR